MKITWIGQAGLLLEKDGVLVMIDPYLSDSVVKVEPKNYRRVPVNEKFLALNPDVMIFTHNHLDHYDPETAPIFLHRTEKRMTVLCPSSVWRQARAEGGGHNYVQFNRGTVWTEYGLRFTAVPAEHSDDHAIGVIVEDLSEGKSYYVTGDTLYNAEIFAHLPKAPEAVFLPINGVGNNMNMTDAAEFAKRVGAKHTVPFHVGMFDELDAHDFECDNRVIPELWKEMEL